MIGWLPIIRKYTNDQYDEKKGNREKEVTQVQRTTNTDVKRKREANK
jgi:hypothetical protein